MLTENPFAVSWFFFSSTPLHSHWRQRIKLCCFFLLLILLFGSWGICHICFTHFIKLRQNISNRLFSTMMSTLNPKSTSMKKKNKKKGQCWVHIPNIIIVYMFGMERQTYKSHKRDILDMNWPSIERRKFPLEFQNIIQNQIVGFSSNASSTLPFPLLST